MLVEGATHVLFSGVVADVNGEIDIDVDPFNSAGSGTGGPDSNFPLAILNGFQITQQQAVPEPASIAVWLLIGSSLIGVRMRYCRHQRAK